MRRHLPLLILVLLSALVASQVAIAASPARPNPTFAQPSLRDEPVEPEEEGEIEAFEDEFEFEECEAAASGEEFGEGESEEEELEETCGGGEAEAAKAAPPGAPFVTAPALCQVRQAESTITTLPGSDQVRLTVRYRTYAPTEVVVGLKLRDRKGSVAIEHATKHLGPQGALHLTTKLGSAVIERALGASEFDVSLRVPESPDFCASALEQRLRSVKHTSARAPRVYSD